MVRAREHQFWTGLSFRREIAWVTCTLFPPSLFSGGGRVLKPSMNPSRLNPILNVSDFLGSLDWFIKLGWQEGWRWGEPPTFGGVKAGNCEIFLCQDAQGGRGRGPNSVTFGPNGDQTSDKGVWMSVWVDDVDSVYERCLAQGLDVTSPPMNHPWHVREMHVRHPDGHVFRISRHLRKGEKPD